MVNYVFWDMMPRPLPQQVIYTLKKSLFLKFAKALFLSGPTDKLSLLVVSDNVLTWTH